MGNQSTLITVTIVTHNSELSLIRCLDSVLAQDWPALEVIVVDNDSRDGTRQLLARYESSELVNFRVIHNDENRGFAAGQNQAMREACGEWILALNPDVLLKPNFVSCLMQAGSQDTAVGTVCGKLLRALPDLAIPENPEMDSAGIYFTPTFRHFDRGMHQPDRKEYDIPAYVFGATGAAAFYRRKMIQDVMIEGEFFDEDFFFSREDADLSWRAQLLGWKCLYAPSAVGYHVRRVFPGVRQYLPDAINRHSVKNRFLMRMKNSSFALYLRHWLPVTVRDLGIAAYCLVRERASLSAFGFLVRNWSRIMAKRRIIQSRRRVTDVYIRSWFRFRPVVIPAPALCRAEQLEPVPAAAATRPILTVPVREIGSSQMR
ncbi:MAG: glycosyltransferase family 2 protein [Acidobacteria bacterium]|nr:glycosyltransferase family 2 protein [Acidobacteriota bacterium]